MLGVASISLESLIHNSLVDGSAIVYARAPTGPTKEIKQIEIGSIQLSLTLEATPVHAIEETLQKVVPAAAIQREASTKLAEGQEVETITLDTEQKAPEVESKAKNKIESHTEAAGNDTSADTQSQVANKVPDAQTDSLSDVTWSKPRTSTIRPSETVSISAEKASTTADAIGETDATKMEENGRGLVSDAEYQAAYEIEMWKRNEMQRWQKQMKQHEMERMEVIETAWTDLEQARAREAALARKTIKVLYQFLLYTHVVDFFFPVLQSAKSLCTFCRNKKRNSEH